MARADETVKQTPATAGSDLDPAGGPRPRWGLWMVGARGSVATTAAAGWATIVGDLAAPDGLVTETPALADLPLPSLHDLVIGGWDVGSDPLRKRAEQLEDAGVIPFGLAARVGAMLDGIDARVVDGVDERTAAIQPADTLDRLRTDLHDFRVREGLDHLVVLNVASTEPPMPDHPAHQRAADLLAAIEDDQPVCSPGALYAVAALTVGAAYVDFTPSAATTLPAVLELAAANGAPVAGRDGKTGETLVKTALAPMFADRGLRVRSWSGTNLLGGGDGRTLADPANAASKLSSKGTPVEAILGYAPEGPVRIDHVEDLGEWKTAWDLITFSGFLGTRMQMQFTWQGCDSALAAPLVLDLARLSAAALRARRSGPQPALGYFFKAPLGSPEGAVEHRLARQFDDLVAWARDVTADDG